MIPTQSIDELERKMAAVAAGAALAIVVLIRLRQMAAAAPPDPWPAEVDRAIREKDAIPVCVNCLQPQSGHQWFCPQCAHPSGEFVATMPYLTAFVNGALFRQGVMGPPEKRAWVLCFFALYSAANFVWRVT